MDRRTSQFHHGWVVAKWRGAKEKLEFFKVPKENRMMESIRSKLDIKINIWQYHPNVWQGHEVVSQCVTGSYISSPMCDRVIQQQSNVCNGNAEGAQCVTDWYRRNPLYQCVCVVANSRFQKFWSAGHTSSWRSRSSTCSVDRSAGKRVLPVCL